MADFDPFNLGILSQAKTYTDIERFIKTHYAKLNAIFRFQWRVRPCNSAIRRILIALDPEDIEEALQEHTRFLEDQKCLLRRS